MLAFMKVSTDSRPKYLERICNAATLIVFIIRWEKGKHISIAQTIGEFSGEVEGLGMIFSTSSIQSYLTVFFWEYGIFACPIKQILLGSEGQGDTYPY